MYQERNDQDFEAWLHDKLSEWQQVPKPLIDEDDQPEQVASIAKAIAMKAKLEAEERAV